MSKNMFPESGKNAVIYARYSSSGQRDESIEGQLRDCRAYAAANGLNVIGEYCDAALTGRTDARPNFQRMIKDSEKHLFSVVICWKIDRFSRNRYDAAMYKNRLKNNGVRIVYAKEAIPDDPTGIILESLMEGMAEYYSANLSQNVRRGNYDSVLKGSALGHQCYGYDIGEDHAYHINESEAVIVQRIFLEYANGKHAKDIIDDLHSDGIRNKKGKKFNHNFIATLIGNEKYKGIYRYYEITVPIERIVSDDLWEAANSIMAKHKHAPAAKNDFILTGKLYCGECGAPYTGTGGTSHTGTVYHYYGCNGRLKSKSCSMPNLDKDSIEQRVIDAVCKCLHNDEWIEQIAADCVALQERDKDPELEALISRRRSADTAINNLVAALEFTSDPAVLQRISERRAELAELDAAILTRQKLDLKLTAPQICLFLRCFAAGDLSVPEYRRKLVDTFVNKVVIYKDRPPVLILNTTGTKAQIDLSDIPDSSDFNNSGVPMLLNKNLCCFEF